MGAAFDAGDADKAEDLIDVIIDEGRARWKLDSIENDLEASARQLADILGSVSGSWLSSADLKLCDWVYLDGRVTRRGDQTSLPV